MTESAGCIDTPTLEQTVEEIMGRWPATARVFIRRKMACVGCIMAPFQTLSAAARSYQIPENELLGEIRMAMGGDAAASKGQC